MLQEEADIRTEHLDVLEWKDRGKTDASRESQWETNSKQLKKWGGAEEKGSRSWSIESRTIGIWGLVRFALGH